MAALGSEKQASFSQYFCFGFFEMPQTRIKPGFFEVKQAAGIFFVW